MNKSIKIFFVLLLISQHNVHALSSRAAASVVTVVGLIGARATHKARIVEDQTDCAETTYKIFARARATAIGVVGTLATIITACAVFKRTPKARLRQAQENFTAARAHQFLATKHAAPQKFFVSVQHNAAVQSVADITHLEQQLEKGVAQIRQAQKDFGPQDAQQQAQCDQSLQHALNDLQYLSKQKRAIETWYGLEQK